MQKLKKAKNEDLTHLHKHILIHHVFSISSHWWINEGYPETCLEEAEYLASLTPVRLGNFVCPNQERSLVFKKSRGKMILVIFSHLGTML